jgi:hypothetical protein
MINDLTILTVTKVEPFSPNFLLAMQDLARTLGCEFVIAADGQVAEFKANALCHYSRIVRVDSVGFLESVHDDAIKAIKTPYVLRLDDDEKASPAMIDWLSDRAYRAADHWKFARANLWTPTTYIRSGQLWPDHQTRLSIKAKAQGRNAIHAGSPFGGGRIAPVAIEHYKFIVKSYTDRLKIAQSYDKIMNGSGTGGMKAFNLPEDVYDKIPLEEWKDGSVDY